MMDIRRLIMTLQTGCVREIRESTTTIQEDKWTKSFYINRLMSIMGVRSLRECIG